MSTVAVRSQSITTHRLPFRLLLCLGEARPLVQLVSTLRYLVGAQCAPGGGAPSVAVLTGAGAWWAASTCVYLFNGLMDLPEDRANGSRRPLARGALDPRTARGCLLALLPACLGLSLFAPLTTGCVLVFLVLGYLYSGPRLAAKLRTWSTSCVTTAATFTTYLAGALATGSGVNRTTLVFATVMSLWVGLIAAVSKDLGSADGDALAGRRTLAVTRGEPAVRAFCSVAALGLAGAALLGAAVSAPSAALTVAAVALSAGALLFTARCLRPAAASPRAPYRICMVTQYAVHVATGTALAAGL
ncbi:UbiA family prenyltransferase [Streptomyces sp. NBC_01622]|uniref:UbiA family prenyltransferase n=1 Tax=Streptomyces sp. NBC_01622 TaxID=2975903 RepID=UPI0038687B40|nr:UbiA family prenyltransferase [Streptomyces sp. NBC_01622]